MTEFLETYNLTGLAIGACTFLIIGLFHPIVIKCHYRVGTGCWWWFLVIGAACCAGALAVTNIFWSTLLGVTAFSSFWTIGEIFQQQKRVDRGWFPRNPRHEKK